ncbi:MAG TPA: hypothetical protein VK206_07615 [Anaerolineales bacterium]|nr:hypothetical protein [Anaerolineales bacterium]HLO29595.1 hypothetical protein [Anaerolineales bacterium]
MKKNLAAAILQYTIRILLFELGLAIILGAILFLRENSLDSFGQWMFWAGLVIMAIGASSLLGNWGVTRSGTYQIGMTVGEQDISSRTRADLREEQASFSFLQLSLGVGFLAILISGLL